MPLRVTGRPQCGVLCVNDTACFDMSIDATHTERLEVFATRRGARKLKVHQERGVSTAIIGEYRDALEGMEVNMACRLSWFVRPSRT